MKKGTYTNERIMRTARLAVSLYKAALEKGMSNQRAIDAARLDKRILVSDVTMRRYIRIVDEETKQA